MATICLVAPTVKALKTMLDQKLFEGGLTNVATRLVRQLKASLETGFDGLLRRFEGRAHSENAPFSQEIYWLAPVFDPSLKTGWLDTAIDKSETRAAAKSAIKGIVNSA